MNIESLLMIKLYDYIRLRKQAQDDANGGDAPGPQVPQPQKPNLGEAPAAADPPPAPWIHGAQPIPGMPTLPGAQPVPGMSVVPAGNIDLLASVPSWKRGLVSRRLAYQQGLNPNIGGAGILANFYATAGQPTRSNAALKNMMKMLPQNNNANQ
ncbi:MAG: hypothetical protein ACPL1K_03690 [Candidatus Kryptoniota bacterium]